MKAKKPWYKYSHQYWITKKVAKQLGLIPVDKLAERIAIEFAVLTKKIRDNQD